MTNGKFQGSNTADFSSGVADLYTIASQPAEGWNQVTITNTTSFRYVRYVTPANGYLNVAEIEFYGTSKSAVKGATTGTNSVFSSNMIVYPNPATNRIYFSENVSEAGLFSFQGQQILSACHVNSLDVNFLSKGLYIVRIVTADGTQKSTKLEIR